MHVVDPYDLTTRGRWGCGACLFHWQTTSTDYFTNETFQRGNDVFLSNGEISQHTLWHCHNFAVNTDICNECL